jgi:hypothetical protein
MHSRDSFLRSPATNQSRCGLASAEWRGTTVIVHKKRNPFLRSDRLSNTFTLAQFL